VGKSVDSVRLVVGLDMLVEAMLCRDETPLNFCGHLCSRNDFFVSKLLRQPSHVMNAFRGRCHRRWDARFAGQENT
jgi:hypothetical protein